ncbi:MAG: AraC family transcriptional regulator [Bacteroidales bacterium]|nr:AraC family transcriptional regulator [Bacteroidales bacterium]
MDTFLPLFGHPLIAFKITEEKTNPVALLIPEEELPAPCGFHSGNTCFIILLPYHFQRLLKTIKPAMRSITTFPPGTPEPVIATAVMEMVAGYLLPSFQQLKPRPIEEALTLIENNHGKISVKDIAHRLHRSERQLRRQCNHLTGYPPKNILKLQQLKATWLLISQGMPVERALYSHGYYDFSHFTKNTVALMHRKPAAIIADKAYLHAIHILHHP